MAVGNAGSSYVGIYLFDPIKRKRKTFSFKLDVVHVHVHDASFVNM